MKKKLLQICLILTIIAITFFVSSVISPKIYGKILGYHVTDYYFKSAYCFAIGFSFFLLFLLIIILGNLQEIKNHEKKISRIQEKETLIQEIKYIVKFLIVRICYTHKNVIASERFKTMRIDAYENISHDNWYNKELEIFYNKVILRDLNDYKEFLEDEDNSDFKDEIFKFIDELSREAEDELFSKKPIAQKMDGQTYETFVAELLTERNFEVQLTKTTGDQGVDIIAKKNGISFAIQCKRYSHKVGNAAVQEVISGMKFYKTNFGVVVTNNQYTKSAIELANVSNIMLLHDTELNKLDSVF